MMPSIGIRWKGDLWALISAFTTGSGLIIAQVILKAINPISFNGQMFFIGGVIVFIDSVFCGKIKETLRIRPAQLGFLILISFIFCGATLLLFTALTLSEPATVSFLSRLELIATIILASLFLKERIKISEIVGLILVIAGIIVLRYQASIELSQAVFLVIGSSLLFGAGEVLIKSRIARINHRAIIFYRNIFMSIIFAVVGSSAGIFMWANNIELLGLLILAGLFLPYMGRLGYLKAMQNINVSRASVIVQSQPFFAAIAALMVLGTFPPTKEIVGGLLIVTGVVSIKFLEMRAGHR
jgi:drug/metabolite transporter (DMT)-like permease